MGLGSRTQRRRVHGASATALVLALPLLLFGALVQSEPVLAQPAAASSTSAQPSPSAVAPVPPASTAISPAPPSAAAASSASAPGSAGAAQTQQAPPSTSAAPSPVPAWPAAACLSLHEGAQELALEGKLLAARRTLRQCAVDACPGMVRADCRLWLGQTERSIPTLIFELRNPDVSAGAVQLLINDQPVQFVVDSPLEFDPGTLRVRLSAAGYPQIEQELVLREGERNRVIPVRFQRPAAPAAPAVPAPAVSATLPPPSPVLAEDGIKRSRLLATYVLGGVALAATASATYFGVVGVQDARDAQDRCSPLCSKAEADRIRQKLILADVSGGIALLSATLAVALIAFDVDADDDVAEFQQWQVTHQKGGVHASYQGAF